MSVVYFTICSRNYLGYALTCRASLQAAEPDALFVIYLADEPPGVPLDGVEIVTAAELEMEHFESLAFKFSILEFNTAIKPACFHHAFDTLGASTAVYLDPDIEVHSALRTERIVGPALAPAMLTPHLNTPPPDDGCRPTLADIEASGRYNLGLLALADHPQARKFLDWWRTRCEAEGYNAPERGLFVDQKFVDLALQFMPDAALQEDPGWNVAYWNLHERAVKTTQAGYQVNGVPLALFHFSGVVPGDASTLSKHQTRFDTVSTGPAVAALVRAYVARLAQNGQGDWSSVVYAYGRFDDGIAIPDAARRLIWRAIDGSSDARMPFAARHQLCNAMVSQPVSTVDAPVSALMAEIHAMRPDLMATFDLSTERGRRGFARWFLRHGAVSLRLADVFVNPVNAAFSRPARSLAALEAGAARLRA